MEIKELTTRLLKGVASNVFIQLFRYFFVGGVAFIVDFGLLYFFTDQCGWHYLMSATFAFTAGLAVNYCLSIVWVFKAYTVKNRYLEFVFFALIGCAGLLFNAFFLYFFTEVCGLYYLYSKLVSTVLVFFWNFGARKFMLFKECK